MSPSLLLLNSWYCQHGYCFDITGMLQRSYQSWDAWWLFCLTLPGVTDVKKKQDTENWVVINIHLVIVFIISIGSMCVVPLKTCGIVYLVAREICKVKEHIGRHQRVGHGGRQGQHSTLSCRNKLPWGMARVLSCQVSYWGCWHPFQYKWPLTCWLSPQVAVLWAFSNSCLVSDMAGQDLLGWALGQFLTVVSEWANPKCWAINGACWSIHWQNSTFFQGQRDCSKPAGVSSITALLLKTAGGHDHDIAYNLDC